MFEDVSKSIKSTLYDRISSPLFGAFLMSWGLWNYKFILILMSNLPAMEKIAYIEVVLYSGFDLLLVGFVYPFLSSAVFIVIYPIPAKHFFRYWHSQQKHLKRIKQKIEDDTPLTLEESREIRRDVFRLEAEYGADISRRIDENERLKNIIVDLENRQILEGKKPDSRKENPVDGADVSYENVDIDEHRVMEGLAEKGGYVENEKIDSVFGFESLKIQYLLEALSEKGYLIYGYHVGRDEHGVSFSTKGKGYAVQKGFVS